MCKAAHTQEDTSGAVQVQDGVEWRVTVHEDAPAVAEHKACIDRRTWTWLVSCMIMFRSKVVGFASMVWKIGADDPRRVLHGFKVGLALTLVSVFYYVRPLYDCVGGTAMWAVLTVVVVFEYTVGGCLYKGFNRVTATLSGGALALGVQWVASKAGNEFEPIIISGSLFLLAAAATFSRFIPTLKARFDYGLTVFILTYSLVAVSGYRIDSLLPMAQQRLTTIALGVLICLAVCVLVFPVWAGQELHHLTVRNMEKLAGSVEGCVEEYFADEPNVAAGGRRRPLSAKVHGYKFVLNSKASEEAQANLARWEPGHGKFGFRHPYGQYLKVGAAMRSCAYCVDALSACVGSEIHAPEHVKKHLAGVCTKVSTRCADVLREASSSVNSVARSRSLELVVANMNNAVDELKQELRSLAAMLEEGSAEKILEEIASPTAAPPLAEALPLFTAASLLIETCARAEGVVGAVDALATSARFKTVCGEKAEIEINAPAVSHPQLEASQERSKKDGEETTEVETDVPPLSNPRSRGARGVGELMKVFIRRRSTKRWPAAVAKVNPNPRGGAADYVNDHTTNVNPSPRGAVNYIKSHEIKANPSPRGVLGYSNGHTAMVNPSPRGAMGYSNGHAAKVPSPRGVLNYSNGHTVNPSVRGVMDYNNGHAASPRNCSAELKDGGGISKSPMVLVLQQ